MRLQCVVASWFNSGVYRSDKTTLLRVPTKLGSLPERRGEPQSDVYSTRPPVSNVREVGATPGALRLGYSWCEPERASVRAWYGFVCTYGWMPFNEVVSNFDTAHNNEDQPSMPSIPSGTLNRISIEGAAGNGVRITRGVLKCESARVWAL